MRLNLRTLSFLLRRSLLAAFDDGCLGIAKGAAYSALLSFFPVLATAAALLVQARAAFVSETIQRFLPAVLPPGTEELVAMQFRVHGERPTPLLIFAGLLSLWAASGVIGSLIEGFQAAYRVPRSRGFLRGVGVSIGLVLMSALPLIAASALILFGSQIERGVAAWIREAPQRTPLTGIWEWVSRMARWSLAFGTTVVVTANLYYFGPFRRQRWSAVWPGAVLATVLWLFATAGFGWYVRNIANYNVMYGSIAGGIALLVWMYLMAAIALVGCEFNAECERLRRI